MAEHRLQFVIDAENKTKAAFSQVSKQMDGMQGKIAKMQPAFKKMALVGTAAFAAIGVGVWKSTQSAVAAEEIFNKFNTVFDDIGDSAEKVAKDLRDNWGLAESTAKELLSSTGDLLSGFGFTGEAALGLSEKTQKLAIDLASFTNLEGGATRASGILTKAMLGEKDSLVALGIKILDSDVKARLLADGKDKLTGLALRQAKAEITLQLAMEQSGKAIGDYERTSESAANRQRLLAERTKELSETAGAVFIPILQMVIDKIIPVIEKIRDWIAENPKLAKNITIAALAISGLLAVVGLLGMALPAIITGFTLLFSPVALIIIIITGLIAIGVLLYKNWDTIVKHAKMIWEAITIIFKTKTDEIKNTINLWVVKVKGTIEKVFNNIKTFFTSFWNGVKEVWGNAIDWLMRKIQPFLDAYNKVRSGVSWVSEKAGGVVSAISNVFESKQTGGYISETKPYLLHKGETVIPADGGSRSIVININGGYYLSEMVAGEMGDMLAKKLKDTLKL